MKVAERILVTIVLGGIGGVLCDQIHVQSGVLSYPAPVFLDQAWWVAPLFAMATPLILAGARPFARRAPEPSRRELVTGTLWFLGAYVGSGLFDARAPRLYAAALVAAWIARMALARPRRALVAWSLILAAGGCAFEAALSSTGAFAYARPAWWVPLWLPGIYLHGAPLAIAVVRSLRWPTGTI